MRKLMFAGLMLVAAATPGSVWAELPKADQICINKINKDGVKVQAAQLKVNDKCVKDAVKHELSPGPTADSCVELDAKGKVLKKRGKTVSDEMKKCGSSPPVFFTDAATTNDASENSAKSLVRDIFGPTLGALQSCDTNPEECLCQVKVVNRVSKLERAIGKVWLRCKKAALKNGKEPFTSGGAEMNSELEQCVTNAALAGGLSVKADTKGKIAKATQQTETTAGQFCAAGTEDEFAGGACAGYSTPPTVDAAGLATCLAAHANCRFCEMVNGTDALSINCDAFAGIACP